MEASDTDKIMTSSLFDNIARDMKIVRIGATDACARTDAWQDLRRMILECEPMYPRISRWIDERVQPSLMAKIRSAFIAYYQGRPVVSCVVKPGRNAKFCHLRIATEFQDANIGDLFFALMTLEVRRARSIHFTLPLSLWSEKKPFFSSFAFSQAERSHRQYRSSDDELHCSAFTGEVWASALSKIIKLRAGNAGSDMVMSVKPRFASAILSGHKKVEVRKGMSDRWIGKRVTLYSTAPDSSMVGEAMIADVIRLPCDDAWHRFGSDMGCTRAEYDDYTRGCDRVSVVVLERVHPYMPFSLQTMRELVDRSVRPPQSFAGVSGDSPWARAVTVASLMRGDPQALIPLGDFE